MSGKVPVLAGVSLIDILAVIDYKALVFYKLMRRGIL
jgi:hypothetical protein